MSGSIPNLSAHHPIGLTLEEQKQEWGAAPPSENKKPVDNHTPKCGACGRHHTDAGITHERAELNCLRRTVKRQREEIEALMEALRQKT